MTIITISRLFLLRRFALLLSASIGYGVSVLPLSVRAALGVMLYGMFIAIVVPQARKEKPILLSVLLALIFSCLFAWVPVLKTVSAGLAIVICTVAAAVVCALVCPVEEEAAP